MHLEPSTMTMYDWLNFHIINKEMFINNYQIRNKFLSTKMITTTRN